MNEPLKIRSKSLGEWSALELSNDLIRLSIVPAIGGRVMDLTLGERNVFYANPRYYGKAQEGSSNSTDIGLWKNYGGSKVWPWPQGWSSLEEWPGPPDPLLDSGPYESKTIPGEERASIQLTSGHDEYSGVTLAREIAITRGTSIVRVHHTMRNSSHRPVRWSIWQISQVDAAQGLDIFVPVDWFRQTLGDLPYKKIELDATRKILHLTYDNQVAQFAVKANQGWLAGLDRSRGLLFVEMFPIREKETSPDATPNGLFWVSGAGSFTIHGDRVDMTGGANGCDPHIETEIIGPPTRLDPGESCEFNTSWRVAAIDAQEIISVNHCGAVGRNLAVTPNRATGSFGVFHSANMELVAFDRASQIAGSFAFGKVSPLQPIVLDEKISLPSNAVRCSLMLFDEDKNRLGVLDHVQIR
jgi:hypothetical protein